MKYPTLPGTVEIPLLKLDEKNNLSKDQYKIHKELIKKEFIKKIISGEITTQQINEVLDKKDKHEKDWPI